MNRYDRHWHNVINAKLAHVAAAATPPWQEAWSCLGPTSSERERLAFFQAVRNAGSLPDEAGFYLVSWQIDAIRDGVTEKYLRELEERLTSIQEQHGVSPDDLSATNLGPPEYQEAFHQWEEAWDVLYPAKLEEFEEPAMAQLFRTDQERYDQIREAGRQYFFGAATPDTVEVRTWMHRLWEAVSACVLPANPMGPLGLRYSTEEDAFCVVTIYPTPVELLGGAHDGAVVTPGFSFDLERLRSAFDAVTAMGWNALDVSYPEGPHIFVEGVYQGREVDLQVLMYAPVDEIPGLTLNMTQMPGPAS